MKLLVWSLILLPFITNSQTLESTTNRPNGIEWIKGVKWNDIIKKAKQDNKYIFVDCFATWCGPCKLMDNEVFSLNQVGDIYNDKFICVKVQMDETINDDEGTKQWRDDAKLLKNLYTVHTFPTYLFFSPDGKPVHRTTGSMAADKFMALADDALDTSKQYYNVVNHYQPGVLDTAELKGLAQAFISFDKKIACRMATEYLNSISIPELGYIENIRFLIRFDQCPNVQNKVLDYLKQLPSRKLFETKNLDLIKYYVGAPKVSEFIMNYLASLRFKRLADESNLKVLGLFKSNKAAKDIADKYIGSLSNEKSFEKKNLLLIAQFTIKSSDRGFKLFYENHEKIDRVMGVRHFARKVIDKVITKEDIDPEIFLAKKNNSEPDWEGMEINITKKYNIEYAKLNIIAAKPNYYLLKNDQQNVNKYLIERVELLGLLNLNEQTLNNWAWQIFQYSDNRNELEKILKWSEHTIILAPHEPMFIDTKANILYKLGRTDEAIAFEEMAVKENDKTKFKLNLFRETLEKMKKGERTWIYPIGNLNKIN